MRDVKYGMAGGFSNVEMNRGAAQAFEAGRDPESIVFYVTAFALIGSNDASVEQLVNHPLARWDAAALITDPEYYRSWEGTDHPIRPDFTYARDLISPNWSREDALAIIEAVPPSIVRRARACGTPDEVAAQIQPYIEAGASWINLVDYSPLLGSGQFGDTGEAVDVSAATVAQLRELNGQPPLTAVAATQGAHA